MKNKYLLLGGSGFIGTNIANKLISQGISVDSLSKNYNNLPLIDSSSINIYQSDISNLKLLNKLIHRNDIIIYLISNTNVRNSINNCSNDLNNISNLINVLDLIKDHDNKKIIFASSGGTVYGHTNKMEISEDHCLNPVSPYGICKVAMEHFIKYYHEKFNLNYIICRYSNPYGKFQNPLSGVGVINKILYNYYKKIPMPIIKNYDKSVRDYIYISDLVDATLTISESETINNTFNIGNGVGYTLKEIIDKIEEFLEDSILIEKSNFGVENISKNVLDISKIKETFNWTPKIDINEGINLNNKWINKYLKLNDAY